MCPSWTRVADEIDSLASDRLLAASVEPEPRERAMLRREAALLEAASAFARSQPGDGHLVHTACEGVVVHSDRFIMWGISDAGERGLRALAADCHDAGAMQPCQVLSVVLGLPHEPAARVSVAA